ncbi:VOC family protein [Brevibacillus daliensis]|uniref:VOC family protein n=1 Tax=Brevibacillus daliensis TaxID=2892995 RepID=UPI001E4BA3EC|nr:VOC family protein [Brevibacillus daliensis]
MFLLDRLIYATNRPDDIDRILTQEKGYECVAAGNSYPGIATRHYPFPGGGYLEIAYVEDKEKATQTEVGQGLLAFLEEQGEGYYSLLLETADLTHVENVLREENYPIYKTGVHEITTITGEKLRMRMLGTSSHLPWFIEYEKTTQAKPDYAQAAIIRTTTLTADVALLEKLVGVTAIMGTYPGMNTGFLPLANASLRLESADKNGISYFEPKGLLLDDTIYM